MWRFRTLKLGGFWLTATGALLVNISLMVGRVRTNRLGWPYPPLSELDLLSGRRPVRLLFVGRLQIFRHRHARRRTSSWSRPSSRSGPAGMDYLRHADVLGWNNAWRPSSSSFAGIPILTATFGDALLDRYLGFHFFTKTRPAAKHDDVHEPSGRGAIPSLYPVLRLR